MFIKNKYILKIYHFYNYFKYLSNPLDCLLFKFNFKKNCAAELKKYNRKVEIKNISTLDKMMFILRSLDENKVDEFIEFINNFDTMGSNVLLNNIIIPKNELSNVFFEYFMPGYYDILELKNRVVIDIGANVADTSLFFAEMGAKEVYAFEPVKKLYDEGLKNIEANTNLSKKIHFFNKGVSCKKGKLNINFDSVSDYVGKEDNYEVDVITLKNIIEDFNITPDILKIDCEGCEFDIIKHSDLSIFNEIIFEHHSILVGESYGILINILEKQGFKIKTFDVASFKFKEIGMVYAYK